MCWRSANAICFERITAKQRVGGEYRYDEREREALAWAIEQLVKAGLVG